MKYIDEFIKYKENNGEKAIYRVNDNCGNTYYGEDYVHWLEEQLRIHDVSGQLPNNLILYRQAKKLDYAEFCKWINAKLGNLR